MKKAIILLILFLLTTTLSTNEMAVDFAFLNTEKDSVIKEINWLDNNRIIPFAGNIPAEIHTSFKEKLSASDLTNNFIEMSLKEGNANFFEIVKYEVFNYHYLPIIKRIKSEERSGDLNQNNLFLEICGNNASTFLEYRENMIKASLGGLKNPDDRIKLIAIHFLRILSPASKYKKQVENALMEMQNTSSSQNAYAYVDVFGKVQSKTPLAQIDFLNKFLRRQELIPLIKNEIEFMKNISEEDFEIISNQIDFEPLSFIPFSTTNLTPESSITYRKHRGTEYPVEQIFSQKDIQAIAYGLENKSIDIQRAVSQYLIDFYEIMYNELTEENKTRIIYAMKNAEEMGAVVQQINLITGGQEAMGRAVIRANSHLAKDFNPQGYKNYLALFGGTDPKKEVMSGASAGGGGSDSSMATATEERSMEMDNGSYPEAEDGDLSDDSYLLDQRNSSDVTEASKAKADKTEEDNFDLDTAKKLSTDDSFRPKTPQLLSRYKSNDLDPLPLKSQEISVVMTDTKVRVVQDLIFENPTSQQLAGNLMIAMPDGATPCYLGMYQGKGVIETAGEEINKWINPTLPDVEVLMSKSIELPKQWEAGKTFFDYGEVRSAKVVEAVKGRQVYEQVTRRRIDPALTEWAGSGNFSTRIFPIPENGYKRVVFAYDAPLKTTNSAVLYPMPVPKEIAHQTKLNIYDVANSFLDKAIVKDEEIIQGNEIVTDNIKRGWSIDLTSQDSGNVVYKAKMKGQNIRSIVGNDEKVSGKLVHAYYTLDADQQMPKQDTGKALFIVDTSYSAKDKVYNYSGKMLKQILENDDSITDFAVWGFDVRTRFLTKGIVKNTDTNRQDAYREINKIWLEGATNFESVLENLNKRPEYKSIDTIFLLSDGLITWGQDNISELELKYAELMQQRWICYSFPGSSVNSSLFSLLTREKGQTITVGAGQELSSMALAHQKTGFYINSISANNNDEIVVAGNPKQVYPGQTLELAIKVKSPKDALQIVFDLQELKISEEIALDIQPLTKQIASRAWADVYVRELLDLNFEQADDVILSLSQRFILSNRVASFIILETDEEYVEHNISEQDINLKQLTEILSKTKVARGYGRPDYNDLSESSKRLLNILEEYPSTSLWDLHKNNIRISSLLPTYESSREKDVPKMIYEEAKTMYEKGNLAGALRILTTIKEISPQDDKASRLVGYVLLEWGLYKEASELFSAIRRRRPFEAQNFIMEGIAYQSLGNAYDAAIRYEIALQREFPRLGNFAKPTAKVLYLNLLKSLITENPNFTEAKRRYEEIIGEEGERDPRGRLLLFWNLDDVDLDLHVEEWEQEAVNYTYMESKTGGKLFWDNTEGLGPELYEHPYLSAKGFKVMVDYYASHSVEGEAPATSLVMAFDFFKEADLPKVSFYTTILDTEENDGMNTVMPLWKRFVQ